MAQLNSVLSTTAWIGGLTAGSYLAGTIVDVLVGGRLLGGVQSTVLAATGQLLVGSAILAESTNMIFSDLFSPTISDGIIFFWFFFAQDHLMRNMVKIRDMVVERLAGVSRVPKRHCTEEAKSAQSDVANPGMSVAPVSNQPEPVLGGDSRGGGTMNFTPNNYAKFYT